MTDTGTRHQDEATRNYTQPEADQAERRRVLKQDDQARSYFEMEAAAETKDGPTVVGASAFGPKLPAPAWSTSLGATPQEPPLGECVDDLVDMETCWWEPGAVGPKGERDGEA